MCGGYHKLEQISRYYLVILENKTNVNISDFWCTFSSQIPTYFWSEVYRLSEGALTLECCDIVQWILNSLKSEYFGSGKFFDLSISSICLGKTLPVLGTMHILVLLGWPIFLICPKTVLVLALQTACPEKFLSSRNQDNWPA